MKAQDIRAIAEREPFRPFSVRLSNGVAYDFNARSQFGAPADFHMIFYFGQNQATRIDVEQITEITE